MICYGVMKSVDMKPLKEIQELVRQNRIVKQRNVLLERRIKELERENKQADIRYRNLVRDVQKAYPTFTI
jgi:hypothetical protein